MRWVGARMAMRWLAAMLFVTGGALLPAEAHAQTGADPKEWRFYGGDPGHTKYTPLDQITEDNVDQLPIGSPVTDYYGGHRPGDNLFANSLVCLDAETGERVWHFQFVHHAVWDYDLPAAPNLIDVTVDGRPIEAVAQITKQGFTFLFDRATGEPVWPIEERSVPPSTVPGERTSPTQPYPTKPPLYLLGRNRAARFTWPCFWSTIQHDQGQSCGGQGTPLAVPRQRRTWRDSYPLPPQRPGCGDPPAAEATDGTPTRRHRP